MVRVCIYINRAPGFFFSNVWKVMNISLPISLVLCFKGNLFMVACIFLTWRIWAAWSQRPFIMGDIEYKFILLLFTNILSMAVLELFWILVPKVTVCDRLYVANNEASSPPPSFFQWHKLCLSPQNKYSTLGLYRCFKASSRFFIDGLNSPVGPLYKIDIINLGEFWHSEDRASWYILIRKPTRCTNFSDLFCNRTLHVLNM